MPEEWLGGYVCKYVCRFRPSLAGTNGRPDLLALRRGFPIVTRGNQRTFFIAEDA